MIIVDGNEYGPVELSFLRDHLIHIRDKMLLSPQIGDTIYLSHAIAVMHEFVKGAEQLPGFVSATCEGERCFCGAKAVKKVGEEIPFDDPFRGRHNLTSYVCADHYELIMGPAGAKQLGREPK